MSAVDSGTVYMVSVSNVEYKHVPGDAVLYTSFYPGGTGGVVVWCQQQVQWDSGPSTVYIGKVVPPVT